MHYLVYQTTNLINQKIYIGIHKTKKIEDGYLGSGFQLTKAIKKYGRENFERIILFNFDNKEEMIAKEKELVNEEFIVREDVYNVSLGGSGGTIGFKHSDESKEKMKGKVNAIDSTGKTIKVQVDDIRFETGEIKLFSKGMVTVKDKDGNTLRVPIDDPRYLSGELVGIRKGIKQSDEQRKQKSESQKGRKHSEETKQQMSASTTGLKRSEETCKRFSERQKGKKLSEETKLRISKSNLGKTNTPEHNERISKAHKGKKRSKEVCENFKKLWIERKEKGPSIWTPNAIGFCKIYNDEGINFIFYSIKDASATIGISETKIKRRMKLNIPIENGKFSGFKICRSHEVLS